MYINLIPNLSQDAIVFKESIIVTFSNIKAIVAKFDHAEK